MNARQRRTLRRRMSAQCQRMDLKDDCRHDMPRALLLNASNRHFDAVARKPYCASGSRKSIHRFNVLNKHKIRVHGHWSDTLGARRTDMLRKGLRRE